MAADETEHVIELFRNDPETYADFLADVSGAPEEYGMIAGQLPPADTETTGKALAVYVSYLENLHPAWDGVDIETVDWTRVMAELAGEVTARRRS